MIQPTIRGVAEALAETNGVTVLELEARLAELVESARASLAGVDVPDAGFLRRVHASVAEQEDARAALATIQGRNFYLAVACAEGHPRALAEFERRYIAEVPRAISRLRPNADFVEEVQQVLRERLLVARSDKPARIAEYSGRGPLGAWVRVAALRTALSLRRGRTADPSPRTLPEQAAATTGAESRALRRRYRPLLKSAVQRALESIEAPERTLLRLHVIEGMTVEQLGARYGVHGSTISRRISRTRSFVQDETRRLLLLEARLNESELTSLVRVFLSDLDVSIRRILGAAGE